ncbi:hypothetical protein V6U81_19995 [Micromonospora sp. CPCC 205711]|uniref:hypothetical protein n=1 Tax=Micromonospora sp. CPCC 205547 TaxID=3122400 RepID=UPI002FF326C8
MKTTLGPANPDTTLRPFTMTFTVSNAGPHDADRIAFFNLEVDEHAGGDWSKCDTSVGTRGEIPSCLLAGPRAGQTRTYTFVSNVPDGQRGAGPPPWITEVAHWDAQNRDWPDVAPQDNSVRTAIPYN